MINEVELNPPGTDAGYEYVELFNPTSTNIDLSGWRVVSTHGEVNSFTILAGSSIKANGYFIITFPNQFLDNSGESVLLYDSHDSAVDSTHTLSDDYNDIKTRQRSPNGVDTNSSSDWQLKAGTKDGAN
jgi:hypothetical protein